MKERPILFSAPMVRALLDGTKTQTRRVCRLQPHESNGMTWWPDGKGTDTGTQGSAPGCYLARCPYGVPGDRLWVREAWNQHDDHDGPGPHGVWWRASHEDACSTWRPSIHMPRWASRILLELTDVRVERLQDIGESDLAAEGIQEVIDAGVDHDGWPRDAYRALWERLNGAGSWDMNPWVWVLEFRMVAW